MFTCHFCRKLIGPGERARRVVVAKREKEYLPDSKGWEIAQEVKACGPCEKTQTGTLSALGEKLVAAGLIRLERERRGECSPDENSGHELAEERPRQTTDGEKV